MTVLPGGFRYDERCVWINFGENFHPFFLASDKTVFFILFIGMGTSGLVSHVFQHRGKGFFQLLLAGPTSLVSRKSEVSVGNNENLFVFSFHGAI